MACAVTLALVVGCAACVWDDVRRAKALANFDRIYCVKMIGVDWPDKFDTWVTLHPEWMNDYEAKRKERGLPNGYEIVAPPEGELGAHGKKGNISRRISYRWPGMTASASSGIYGAKVALDDGHKIVLAGIPMTVDGGHFARGQPWRQRDSFMAGWNYAMPHLKNDARSMSGFSREQLGAPTREWLEG